MAKRRIATSSPEEYKARIKGGAFQNVVSRGYASNPFSQSASAEVAPRTAARYAAERSSEEERARQKFRRQMAGLGSVSSRGTVIEPGPECLKGKGRLRKGWRWGKGKNKGMCVMAKMRPTAKRAPAKRSRRKKK